MCLAGEEMLKQEDSVSSKMATEKNKNMCEWIQMEVELL